MVFSGLYPVEAEAYVELREALENCASTIRRSSSSRKHRRRQIRFRCGFPGLLHMEVIQSAWSVSTI